MKFRPRLLPLISGVSIVGLITSAAVPASALPSTDVCGLATLIVVRGTDAEAGTGSAHDGRIYESGGLAGPLSTLVDAAVADPDVPIYVESLAYPATDFAPTFAVTYDGSIELGALVLAKEIEYLVAACPYTNVLLTGYSQGAQVIGNVLAAYNQPPLSDEAQAHVTAVALFADPSYVANETWDWNPLATANGTFARGQGAFSGYERLEWVTPENQGWIDKVRSYCLAGDLFCQNDLSVSAYEIRTKGYTPDVVAPGWQFMKRFLISAD